MGETFKIFNKTKFNIGILIVCVVALIAVTFGIEVGTKESKVLDPSVTEEVELDNGWDKIKPVVVTEDLFKLWNGQIRKPHLKNLKTGSSVKWAIVELAQAQQFFRELCAAYNIREPDSIKVDLLAIDLIRLESGERVVANTQKRNGTIHIQFSEEIYLMYVFHEFYHYLDIVDNKGNWKYSIGENGKCNELANDFYYKYCSGLYKYLEVNRLNKLYT